MTEVPVYWPTGYWPQSSGSGESDPTPSTGWTITSSAIADELARLINLATWDETFTASRKFVTVQDLIDCDTLRVILRPAGKTLQDPSGSQWQRDYRVDLVVQKRIDSDDEDDHQALMDFSTEVSEFCQAQTPLNSVCVHADDEDGFLQKAVQDRMQLIIVCTLTYRFFA